MSAVWTILLILVAITGWGLTLIGMPGNWLIVSVAGLYSLLGPAEGRTAIGWEVVAVLVSLALLGELVEFAAGALGVKQAGGSRRSAVLALAGSVIGSLVGLFITIPVPVIGSLVGAVFFGGIGALAGAVCGEYWKGKTSNDAFRVGHAAFWARLFGTLSKVLIGSTMVVFLVITLLI